MHHSRLSLSIWICQKCKFSFPERNLVVGGDLGQFCPTTSTTDHSSEMRNLCFMKWPIEILQKTHTFGIWILGWLFQQGHFIEHKVQFSEEWMDIGAKKIHE